MMNSYLLRALESDAAVKHFDLGSVGSPAVLVTSRTWQGLYINGLLKIEGYRLTAEEILSALGVLFETLDAKGTEEAIPYFPYELDDLNDRLDDFECGFYDGPDYDEY